MVQQSFNNESGIRGEDHSLVTAYGREQYFDGIAIDPDLAKYGANTVAINLANSNNEGTAEQIAAQANTTGGKLSGRMSSIANFVDKLQEKNHGSRSSNLSQIARNEHEEHIYKTPDHEIPIIGDSEVEIEVAMQYAYGQLLEAGVPETDLNHVMRAGSDPRTMIEELHNIAQDNNVPLLAGYIQDMDQSFANLQKSQAITNVIPAIGTVMEDPELASVNDDNYDITVPPAFRIG